MKCIGYCLLPVAVFASTASDFTIPQFQSSDQAAGGFVSQIASGIGIDYIAIYVDAKAGELVLPLSWSTSPNEKTGEFLRADFFWRIPTRVLGEQKYILSAERESSDEIVFTILKPGSDRPFLKSPRCRIVRDKMGAELKGSRLETRLNVRPNQAAEPTRTSVTPPAASSAKATEPASAGDRASGARGSP
jgi:hypothetical protein